jgi:hypothetical protein
MTGIKPSSQSTAEKPVVADEVDEPVYSPDDPGPGGHHGSPDGDDYRAESGMVGYSNTPGWKSQRQLEKEKIHRLAKMCIEARNVSAPCLDIINVNARMGKFYILQETQEMSPYLKRWSR